MASKAWSDAASLQSVEGSIEDDTEIEDLLVEPAYWLASGAGDDSEKFDDSVDGLQEAALRGDLCLLRKHIRRSAPPVNAPLHAARGDEYLTLLHVIASVRSLPNGAQILQELVEAKANPNARSTLGSTPLMFACFHKNVHIAEVLLENEADPEAVDDHGKTALRYAVSLEMKGIETGEAAKKSAQLADLLESQGGDMDHGGLRSPMAEAVLQDNRDAITRLLELGATSDGLVYALAGKSELVIKELISGGANPFARDQEGQSCWDVAQERGSEEILDLLHDYIIETERSRSQHLKLKPFNDEEPHWTTKGFEHCQWLVSGQSPTEGEERQKVEPHSSVPKLRSTNETGNALLVRYQVQALLENPVVQAILTTNLVLALFLPDFWVILAMQGNGGLDNALVMIFVIFVLEFIANVVAQGDRYVNKYPFWTDIVGILSVPWDHSLVADNFVDIFEGSGLARVTKFAKLSARAVRLSRLGKLLRFVPGTRDEGAKARGQGPAKGISAELMSNLSVKVALLIIILVLILPMIDFFTWPPDDFSLDTWTAQIQWIAKTYPEDVPFVVDDMRRFYDTFNYFPFQVIYHFANNTQVIQELPNSRAPMRLEDVLVIVKDDATVKFNFRAPKLAESILNVFIMIGVIVTIVVASFCVSSAVSHTVLSPMEDLLEIVHSTAIRIFDSVEQMAIYFVKDYSNQQWRTRVMDEGGSGSRFSREVELLSKVLKKLDLLTIIANAKRPVDEFEQLGNGPAAFCQDYATYAAVRHRLTLPRPEGQLELEEQEHDSLMRSIGTELGPVEITKADWTSWETNIADLNAAQRMSLARCLIVIYDTAPGFDDYRTVSLRKYKGHCEFVKVLESQYEDEQVVQYHNWIHAVDTAFTLRLIFHSISAERYFAAHERFALMVAAFSHDLGNFGVTNGFLTRSAHEFSLGYNDLNCLQNMSCAKLFRITTEPETSIFINFDKATQRDVRQVIIFAILHTDPRLQLEILAEMWGHYEGRRELLDLVQQLTRTAEETGENETLAKARKEVEDYFWNADVKYSLRNLLVHVADNSYSLKPWDICTHWANALSEEFFKQGDLERNSKLSMQPLNDRVRANVAFAQIVNIQHIIVPQTKLLVQFLPDLRSCKHHMWLNLWRWIAKWRRSRPDHEELQRVLREVKELHDEDIPEEEIRALELQQPDESEDRSSRPPDQNMTRRLSVKSMRVPTLGS